VTSAKFVYKQIHSQAEAELRQLSSRLDLLFARSSILNRQAAEAEMATNAKQLQRQYAITGQDQSANVVPLSEIITGDVRPILFPLLGEPFQQKAALGLARKRVLTIE
jgi:hypothetical protein